MPSLRVMCVRKSADQSYKHSAQRSLQSLLDALRRRTEVKELWIVHEGGSFSRTFEDHIDVYNAFSFCDGTEIIRILRPDLVIISNDYEYLQRSILKATSAKGIPTVDLLASAFGLIELDEGHNKRKVIGSLQLLKDHPRNILRRHLFLLKTLFRSGYSLGYIFNSTIKDIYLPLISWTPRYGFGGGDLNIVSTPEWENLLIKNGIDRDKIVVSGDISMDNIHFRLANIIRDPGKNRRGKIEILFLTSPMVEHGLWTQDMRKEVITRVVSAIRGQLNHANLTLKIHPTSENLNVYEQLLTPIDPSIEVIQKADLLSLINNSDSIVSFGHSSAILEALLLRKPVFLMNIFNENRAKNFFLKESVVIECNTIEDLMANIKNKTYSNSSNSQEIDNFISKHAYIFDGKCSERERTT